MKAFALCLCLILSVSAYTQSVDPNFVLPRGLTAGEVNYATQQPDGKYLLSGYWTKWDDEDISDLVRINVNGTRDESFNFINPARPGWIEDIFYQSTGHIIVANTNEMHRLNPNGTMDQSKYYQSFVGMTMLPDDRVISFTDDLSGNLYMKVHDPTLRIELSGNKQYPIHGTIIKANVLGDKLYLTGNFDKVLGQDKRNCVRLNLDLTIDETFNPGTRIRTPRLLLQDDRKLLVHNHYLQSGETSHLVRLNNDGSADESFAPPSLSTKALVSYYDSKIWVIDESNFYGTLQYYLFRLNEDGSIDELFTPKKLELFRVNNTPFKMFPTSNGLMLTGIGNDGQKAIALMSPDGTIQKYFNPPLLAEGSVRTAALMDDNHLVIGGDFVRINGISSYRGAKISSGNGSASTDFVIDDFLDIPLSVKVFNDHAYFGTRVDIQKIQRNGQRNPAYYWTFYDNERPLMTQFSINSSGQLYVANNRRLYRFTNDGILDPSFTSFGSCCSSVHITHELQSDGKVILYASHLPLTHNVVRLNVDGTKDNTFTLGAGFGMIVEMFHINEQDEIFLSSNYYHKLNPDGSVNQKFAGSEATKEAPLLGMIKKFNDAYIVSDGRTTLAHDENGRLLVKELLPATVVGYIRDIVPADTSLYFIGELEVNGEQRSAVKIDFMKPKIASVKPLIVGQNSPLEVHFEDITLKSFNSNYLHYTVKILPGDHYTTSGNKFTPEPSFYGPLTVNVTVSNGFSISDPFPTNVYVNKTPKILTVASGLIVSPSHPLSISLSDVTVDDPDSEPDNCSVIVWDEDHYSVNDNMINVEPGFSGVLTCKIQVSDGYSQSAPFEFEIAANKIPTVATQSLATRIEDEPFQITLNDISIDDDNINRGYSLTILSGNNYAVNDNTTITPINNFFGDLHIAVAINDGYEMSQTQTMVVPISPVNDAAVMLNTILLCIEDNMLALTTDALGIVDVDGPASTPELTFEDGDNYIIENGQFIPNHDFFGAVLVPVKVFDGIDEVNTILTINVTGVNDPPAFISIPQVRTNEDNPISIEESVTFLDVDDPLNAVSIAYTEGVNYAVKNRMIIPSPDFYGTINVPIRMFDGKDYSQPAIIPIEVLPVNDPPVVDAHRQAVVDEDIGKVQLAEYFKISDVDSPDELSFEFTADVNCTVDKNGILVPNKNFWGTLKIGVIAYDGALYSLPQTITVSVIQVNDPPAILSIPSITVDEDFQKLPFTLDESHVSDPDNAVSELSVVFLPGTHYQLKDGSVIPETDWNGTLNVNLKIYDGKDYSEPAVLSVILKEVNDPPVILSVPHNRQIAKGMPLELTISDFEVEDPDNTLNDLTLILEPGEGYSVDNNFIYLEDLGKGNIMVSAKVSDGDLTSGAVMLSVQVATLTSVEETSKAFSLFPQPAHELLAIKFERDLNITSISILNIMGKQITTLDLQGLNTTGELTFSVEDLPSGYFILCLNTTRGVLIKKFLKY